MTAQLLPSSSSLCGHGFWLRDCAMCQKHPGECDYGSCTESAATRIEGRLMCSSHARADEWEIAVCGACNLPVEACRCEPEDWVSPAGEQLEPPSRIVRVAPVEDRRAA